MVPGQFNIWMTTAISVEAGSTELSWVRDFLLIALSVALMTSIASVVFSASVAKAQLTPLTKTIESIKDLDDADRRFIPQGADEIKSLGQSFNNMLETLQKTSTSRDYLDSIFSGISAGIIVTDKDGIIQTVNAATEDLFGLSADLLEGRPVNTLFSTASTGVPQTSQLSAAGFLSGDKTRVMTVEGKNGKLLDLELRFTRLQKQQEHGHIVVCRNITERLKAEKELAASEAKHRKIIQSANEGFVYLDPGLDIILDINDALTEMLGYRDDEMIGRKIAEFCDEDSANKLNNLIIPGANESTSPIEITMIRKDDHLRHVKFNLNIARDRNGKILSRFVFLTDLTQEVEIRKNLEAAKQAAEDTTRMKSEFLANMSHEIRTPMNGVIGMLELLNETKLSDQQKNFITTALKSADMQMSVINDILDYSKIEAGKLELETTGFNLKELMEDVITLLGATANSKNLKLSSEFSTRLPQNFMGDPTRLRQILVNLVGNAIKFTDEGSVSVECRSLEKSSGGHRLKISVKDTGIGIANDIVPLLFEPFIQADSSTTRKFGGTGLGLMICKSIVETMGGKIGVQSKIDEGTEFWVELVLSESNSRFHTDDIVQDNNSPEARTLAGAKILLVEDTFINQQVALGFLKSFGCETDIANDGLEALDRVSQDKYDLILMDVQMPNLDGYGATKHIREFEKAESAVRTPIIALTAHAMQSDRILSLENDMDDHLSKPIKKEVLKQILDKWLIESQDIQENQDTDLKIDLGHKPSFDENILNQLKNNLSDQPDIYKDVLADFIDNFPATCDSLRVAFDNKDEQVLKRTAHSLKSGAATVGAMAISELARKIECAETPISNQTISECLGSLEQEFQDIAANLQTALEQS